jgi:hypothetical protein
MMGSPKNALAADLLWWRTAQGMRTTASLLWGRAQPFADALHIQARLFDGEGRLASSWRIPLRADEPVFIDSHADGPWRAAGNFDGVLALYACTEHEPSAEARASFNRFFPILDWRRDDGRSVSLHSDQVVRSGREATQRFTEIVVLEADDERNSLILLNGEQAQPAGALEVTVTNSVGESKSAKYDRGMRPFTANQIALASLFPNLTSFAQGQPLLVSGQFASHGLFNRPYVETTGRRWGAYHAGDIYPWPSLPYAAHALIGGEVNPAAVIHDESTSTFINLLHSHGELDDDMPVDAALFDADGNCVARRNGWRVVPRNGLSRFDIAELLPDPSRPFRGHIALSFPVEPGRDVPRRLQALIEYRQAASVARVMTWSDEWNSKLRLARRERSASPMINRSFFRVRLDDESTTEIALTNAGHADYRQHAEVRVVLVNPERELAETTLSLRPYATSMRSIEQLFPDARNALAPSGLAIVLVESTSDLANLAFTRHRKTGAMAAEHFMAIPIEQDGRIEWPSGN